MTTFKYFGYHISIQEGDELRGTQECGATNCHAWWESICNIYPSYELTIMQRFESFENPMAGSRNRSNGSHDNGNMVALLEVFIKKYVECYGCGNPETEILISKTQMISLRCAADGFRSFLSLSRRCPNLQQNLKLTSLHFLVHCFSCGLLSYSFLLFYHHWYMRSKKISGL